MEKQSDQVIIHALCPIFSQVLSHLMHTLPHNDDVLACTSFPEESGNDSVGMWVDRQCSTCKCLLESF